MKRELVYNSSVDLLSEALRSNNLVQGSTKQCAVAHLLNEASARTGINVSRWSNIFCTVQESDGTIKSMMVREPDEIIVFHEFGFFTRKKDSEVRKQAEKLLSNGAYSISEYAEIEKAFETADNEINGALAVIDVLDKIHDNCDKSITQSAKEKITLIKKNQKQNEERAIV